MELGAGAGATAALLRGGFPRKKWENPPDFVREILRKSRSIMIHAIIIFGMVVQDFNFSRALKDILKDIGTIILA